MCGFRAVTSISELSRCSLIRFSFGFNPRGAAFGKGAAAVGEEFDRRENVVQHDRFIDVQLEVALRARERNRMVVSEHLDRHHRQRLALCGIDLSRHDGRAWLVRGNFDLPYTGPRTAGIPTNIVGNLQERPRKRAQHCAHAHHAIVRRERRKLVGSRNKRFPGLLRDSPCGDLPKTRISVEPRADRRASDRQAVHSGERLTDAVACLIKLRNPT